MRTHTKIYILAAKNIQQGCGTVPLVIDLIIWKGKLMHQMVLYTPITCINSICLYVSRGDHVQFWGSHTAMSTK